MLTVHFRVSEVIRCFSASGTLSKLAAISLSQYPYISSCVVLSYFLSSLRLSAFFAGRELAGGTGWGSNLGTGWGSNLGTGWGSYFWEGSSSCFSCLF